MSHFNNLIDDVVRGDDRVLAFTIEDMDDLDGDSLSTAWLTIKENEDDTDAQAIIQKEITTSISLTDGHIDIAGGGSPVEDAHMFFLLSKTDTRLPEPYIYYWYDVKVSSSAGADKAVDGGRIMFIRGITITGSDS